MLTIRLRSDPASPWAELRTSLTGLGLEPNELAIGTLFPDQQDLFGILAHRDGRLVTFMFRPHSRRGSEIEIIDAARSDRSGWAAMEVLRAEGQLDVDPIEVLVDYVAHVTETLWSAESGTWSMLAGIVSDAWPDPRGLAIVHLSEQGGYGEPHTGNAVLVDQSGQAWDLTITLTNRGSSRARPTMLGQIDSESILGPLLPAALQFLRSSSS